MRMQDRDDLVSIPCVLMRGGTSKGPFFLADDLPREWTLRDRVLVSGLGSGHPLQIDGIGGGHALTSKVAIISRSSRPGIDVDYLFAQVGVTDASVDTSPNCGNMLAAVGPYAIEQGLVTAGTPTTLVKIYNINTDSEIEAEVQTPGGRVTYRGNVSIDGVPGRAAPVMLTFMDAAAKPFAQLFPTGQVRDLIDQIEVTCIVSAMPMMIVRATDLGLTGHEAPAELNGNLQMLQRLENLRQAAGLRMRLGDVGNKVVPKPVLIAPPQRGGDISVRYFMPRSCHPALASTGAIGLASATLNDGTLVADIAGARRAPARMTLEHPAGTIDIHLVLREGRTVAGILRTARRLFEGRMLVPRDVSETRSEEQENIMASAS